MRPYIEEYQAVGLKQRAFFVPDALRQIRVRRAMSVVTRFALGRRLLSKALEGAVEARTTDITAKALQRLRSPLPLPAARV